MGPSQKIVVFVFVFVFPSFFFNSTSPQKKSAKSGVTKVDHWGGVTILYIYIHNHIGVFAQNIGA